MRCQFDPGAHCAAVSAVPGGHTPVSTFSAQAPHSICRELPCASGGRLEDWVRGGGGRLTVRGGAGEVHDAHIVLASRTSEHLGLFSCGGWGTADVAGGGSAGWEGQHWRGCTAGASKTTDSRVCRFNLARGDAAYYFKIVAAHARPLPLPAWVKLL